MAEGQNGDKKDRAEEEDALPTLYFHGFSHYSRKVLVALKEKDVKYREEVLDLGRGGPQKADYLKNVNPRGEVPAFKHGDRVVTDSTPILRYIDDNFGEKGALFPEGEKGARVEELQAAIDACKVYEITFGVTGFHKHGLVKEIRYPMSWRIFHNISKRKAFLRAKRLEKVAEDHKDTDIAKEALAKIPELKEAEELFSDRDKFVAFLGEQEKLFDKLEEQLEKKEEEGPWLTGKDFTAADVTLSNLMVRLYQIGMDDKWWNGGKRPKLEAYQKEAFERPSVLAVSDWKKHRNSVYVVHEQPTRMDKVADRFFGMLPIPNV